MPGPYVPAALSLPMVNPTYSAFNDAPDLISLAEYGAFPTAMSTTDLIPGGNSVSQEMEAAELLHRASEWVDRICFGSSASSSRPSLRASFNVEQAEVPLTRGWLKLTCDVKPIIEVRGVDVGLLMGNLTSIGPNLSSAIRIGRRTIYVPYGVPFFTSSFRNYADVVVPSKLTVVWAYVGGFPHSSLAVDIGASTAVATLKPTDGSTGLFGVYPGTRMTIVDPPNSEEFTVLSVTANAVTATANFRYTHTVPSAPNFIPVTSMPPGVRMAAIYLTTALLKTRGDSSISLEEITEPRRMRESAGEPWSDVKRAKDLLKPYRMRIKVAR